MSDLFGLSDETEDMAQADRNLVEVLDQAKMGNPEEPEDIPIGSDELEDDPSDDEADRDRKKRERPRLMKALEEERLANRKTREELAEMRGALRVMHDNTMQARHAGTPQADPIQTSIDQSYEAENALRREAQAIYDSAAAGRSVVTDDMRKDFERRHQHITQRRSELTTMKVMRENGVRPVDPNEGLQKAIQAQYHDVYSNENSASFARAKWQQYRAIGHKDTPELLRHVMTETRAQFKLGNGPSGPASNAMKQKYQGVTGGGAQGPTAGNRNSVRMTPDMKSIAETHYEHRSDLSSRQKYELWAKEVGPNFLKAQRNG